jgi:hypothetical protein
LVRVRFFLSYGLFWLTLLISNYIFSGDPFTIIGPVVFSIVGATVKKPAVQWLLLFLFITIFILVGIAMTIGAASWPSSNVRVFIAGDQKMVAIGGRSRPRTEIRKAIQFHQYIAIGFAGDPVAPFIFNGDQAKKNSYTLSATSWLRSRFSRFQMPLRVINLM